MEVVVLVWFLRAYESWAMLFYFILIKPILLQIIYILLHIYCTFCKSMPTDFSSFLKRLNGYFSKQGYELLR